MDKKKVRAGSTSGGGGGRNVGIEKLISFPPSLKTLSLLFRLGLKLSLFHLFFFLYYINIIIIIFFFASILFLQLGLYHPLTFNGSMFCGHTSAIYSKAVATAAAYANKWVIIPGVGMYSYTGTQNKGVNVETEVIWSKDEYDATSFFETIARV